VTWWGPDSSNMILKKLIIRKRTIMTVKKPGGLAVLLLILLTIPTTPVFAENFPGVFTSDHTLIFVQDGNNSGDLTGVVVLSYEFSMDWIITTGASGFKASGGLILTDGHQYVYNADGTRQSEIEFTSLESDFDWAEMEFTVLPSYSYYLAPMVHGGLAYSLVETRSGLPTQMVLASEVIETETTINLFEGFLYQISEGELTGQIAFTETAFGSQGLVRGEFPENFPPPPEDYPSPYPEYPTPSYPPPSGVQPTGSAPNNYPGPTDDIFFPQGTEVPPDQVSDQPRFTFEPVSDYDVPQMTRIGLVTTRSYAELEGWESTCDEFLQELVGSENLEVVLIPWDSNVFGGAVRWDRAVWLCAEYGVDALMLSELYELEMPGIIGPSDTSRTVRINAEIRSKVVDGVGGGEIWEGEFEIVQIHDYYEIQDDEDYVIRADLFRLIGMMTDDIHEQGILDGFHVD